MPDPWWMTDTYDSAVPVPVDLLAQCGPSGAALVRVWPEGRTDAGWGLTDRHGTKAFIPLYAKGRFKPAPVLAAYQRTNQPFALVTRSLRVVCIDIDGKNGGLTHVGKLGMLPKTMAETSKSGDGYHLFYAVTDDDWDPDLGFGKYADRIGIVQGVDIRGTGCVYHYPSQRWNDRPLVELPQHIKDRLLERQFLQAAAAASIVKILDSEDKEEVLIMQHELLTELAKANPPQGKRNNTLFAIGQKLKLAQVPDWDKALGDRAVQLGLDALEAAKLVTNVRKYN